MSERITAHYSRGSLLDRLRAALREDGVDPDYPTLEDLAPYDHFHGRGIEATTEVADQLQITADDHILDIGSGIGGPARYMADRFGARVTGIDLTAAFCEAARQVTAITGLADRVSIEQGDALAMPFADASFDGAYSMNVSMNIADKAALYAEIRRVLRPGAWLMLSEIAQGPNGAPEFPTPWALTEESSFLATPAATMEGLEAVGFSVTVMRETTRQALAYGDRSRAIVQSGGKLPHRAVGLIHGDLAADMAGNTSRAMAQGSLVPIEVFCRRP